MAGGGGGGRVIRSAGRPAGVSAEQAGGASRSMATIATADTIVLFRRCTHTFKQHDLHSNICMACVRRSGTVAFEVSVICVSLWTA